MSDQPAIGPRHLITTYLWGAGFWPEAAIAGLFKFLDQKEQYAKSLYIFSSCTCFCAGAEPGSCRPELEHKFAVATGGRDPGASSKSEFRRFGSKFAFNGA
jgi:hypothetical protein